MPSAGCGRRTLLLLLFEREIRFYRNEKSKLFVSCFYPVTYRRRRVEVKHSLLCLPSLCVTPAAPGKTGCTVNRMTHTHTQLTQRCKNERTVDQRQTWYAKLSWSKNISLISCILDP